MSQTDRRSSFLRYSTQMVLLAVVYVAAAKLGFFLSFVDGNVTLVWPPSGIALVALLLFGYRLWPGLVLGAFLANFSTGAPLGFCLATAVGNPLEAVVGVYLLRRVVGFNSALDRVRDVLGLAVFAALLSTMIAATIGVTGLCLSGMKLWSAFGLNWYQWWMGDAMGVLVVAPVLLSWSKLPSTASRRTIAEAVALFTSLLLICWIVFVDALSIGADHYSLEYLVFPWLIGAAFRLGQRGTTLVGFVISSMTVWGLLNGRGPFVRDSLDVSLFLFAVYVCVMSAMGLFLAALISERMRIEKVRLQENRKLTSAEKQLDQERLHREILERLRHLLEKLPTAAYSTSADGIITYFNEQAVKLWGREPQLNDPVERFCGSFKLYSPDGSPLDHDRCWMALAIDEDKEYRDQEIIIERPDGSRRTALAYADPIHDGSGKLIGAINVLVDITQQKRVEKELATRSQNRRVAAELGQLALAETDLSQLMDAVTTATAKTLGVEFCKILELVPEREHLLLKSGVGWRDGLVGVAVVGMERGSQAGYALARSEPVVVNDLRTETRLQAPSLLTEHGVVSGMSVIIGTSDEPYGVLGVHCTHPKTFTDDDVQFIQLIANLLAQAIDRKGLEDSLRQSNARLEERVQQRTKQLQGTNEQLHGLAAKHQKILETTLDGFVLTDAQGKIVDVNPAYCSMVGYAHDELIGMSVAELDMSFSNEDYCRHLTEFERTDRARFERKHRHRDGHLIDMEVSVSWITSSGQLQVVSFVRDMTDRNRSERERAEALARFESIAVNVPDCFWSTRIDEHGRQTLEYVSPGWERIWGYSAEEIYDDPDLWLKAVEPDHNTTAENASRGTVATGKPHTVIYRIRSKQGDLRWIEDSFSPTVDQDGRVVRVEGIARDITQRRAAEAALRITQFSLDHSTDGVFWADKEAHFTYVNESAVHTSGYTREELLQMSVFDVDPVFLPGRWNELQGQSQVIESRFRRKDGSEFPVELSLKFMKYDDVEFLVAFMRDITNRKQMESQLQKKTDHLEAVFAASPDMYFECAEDSRIVNFWTGDETELFRPPHHFMGKRVDEFMPTPPAQQILEAVQQVSHTKQPRAIDYSLSMPQGERWYEARIVPLLENHVMTYVRDISERKQVLDALRRQTRLLEEAQQTAHLGNWEWDSRTNQLTWSDELYRIYGLDPQHHEISFERFMDAVHPDDRDTIQQTCRRALQTGEPFTHEERIHRPDGSERNLRTHGHVLHDDLGQPLKLRGICLDVTEQRLEELRFRGLLEAAPDAMVIVDESGTIALVNQQTETLFDYDRGELLGQPIEILVPQRLHSKHVEHRKRFFQQPSFRPMGREMELRGVRKDGQEFPVEISLSPLQTPQGQLVTAAIRDVTQRKQAEEELRRSEKRLTDAQRVGQIGCWDWDVATDTTWWSAELYHMFRVDPQQFTPSLTALLEVVVPDDRQPIRDRLQATLAHDEPFEVEYRIKVDDTVRFHTSTAELFRDDAGQPMSMLGTVQDVTEQRHLQQQLRRTERLASLGTLAAGIAHEINNPMSAAWTAAETAKTLKNRPGREDMLDECLDTVRDAVRRVQVIIENVLRFGRQELSVKVPHDLNDIIRGAVETTSHFTKAHGVFIELDLNEGMPSPTVNATEIEQVLVNLIRNAVQAGQAITVSLSTEAVSDVLRVRVSDNGCGISDGDLGRIFDPFFTRGDGTGLGLSITHGIIEDHKGSIEATSQVGEGTTFTITLPLMPSGKSAPASHFTRDLHPESR